MVQGVEEHDGVELVGEGQRFRIANRKLRCGAAAENGMRLREANRIRRDIGADHVVASAGEEIREPPGAAPAFEDAGRWRRKQREEGSGAKQVQAALVVRKRLADRVLPARL